MSKLKGLWTLPTRLMTTLAVTIFAMSSQSHALEVTPSTTEGPYYTMSSANTVLNSSSSNYSAYLFTEEGTDNDLIHIYSNSDQADGTVTQISGSLVNTEGTPIPGAVIELWLADDGGIYEYVSSSSRTNNYSARDQDFQSYGTDTTDSSGEWSFLAIKPGLYVGRIRHYHYKVKIDGTEYLTSQFMPRDEAEATPRDNIVSSLGSQVDRALYTPVSGTITWDNKTYSGQIVSDLQIVIDYEVSSTDTAPSISSDPSDQAVEEGDDVSFSVSASGTSPLTYQWYKDNSELSGATSATYSISSASSSDAGDYYCIVSNSAGSDTSETATLTVSVTNVTLEVTPGTTEGPYYTLSSANTILDPSNANHAPHLLTEEGTDNDMIHIYADSEQANGTVTKVSGTVVDTSGNAIEGARVELWTADNGGIYQYVSNSSGTNNYSARDQNYQGFGACETDENGEWSFLTIKPGLYVGRIRHYHFKVKIGDTTYVTSQLMPTDEAEATPSDNIVSSLGQDVDRALYTAQSGLITWGSDTYTGEIIADRQLVIDYAATAPSIATQPEDALVMIGESVSFSIAATGGVPLTYQWYKDDLAISGATSATYTIESPALGDAGDYYCVATNSLGSATSATATLTVSETAIAPTITEDPESQSVDVGDAVDFIVEANGSNPLTYQWYKDSASISGASAALLSIDSVTTADAGSYYVIVTNTGGSATSGTATLSVYDPFFNFMDYYGLGDSLATGDEDHDGTPNILEFILGGDPLIPDTEILPTLEFITENDVTTLYFSFYAVDRLGNVSWDVEYTSDLEGEWTTVANPANGQGPQGEPPGGGQEPPDGQGQPPEGEGPGEGGFPPGGPNGQIAIISQETETEGLSFITVAIPVADTQIFSRLRINVPGE